MRIVEVNLYRVRMDLVQEFETSSHRKSYLEHILVELVNESGERGWGETASPSDPYFCGETVDSAWLISERYFIPDILGRQFNDVHEITDSWQKIRGNEFAKSGFDIAAWDLTCRVNRVSLSSALGGTRSSIVAGVSIGIEPSLDELVRSVSLHVSEGYPRVKLKIAPGWDIEPVRTISNHFPNLILQVDANGAYPDEEKSFETFRQLDQINLAMIEQPFSPRNFLASASLQRTIATPICLDESLVTVDDFKLMLAIGAAKIGNIKVSRVGGLTNAAAMHGFAQANGTPVWCGGMHEFGIGRAANIAMSSLPGFSLPSDVSGSGKYYARDVLEAPIVATQGRVEVPTLFGLGVAVDKDFIISKTVQSATFGPATSQLLRENESR